MMNILTDWVKPLISMGSAFLILFWMLGSGMAGFVIDHPNDRSLHTVPVPRTGGLALMSGVLFGWLLIMQPWLLPFSICVVFLMAISFVDDLRGLPAGWRFFAHFVAAAGFLSMADSFGSGLILMGLVLFAMVWMVNLFNFMDGSDGLAGGMAFFGFSGYALAAFKAGNIDLAVALVCVSAASLSFLKFNFHPARIFMGDAGSVSLGFLAGAFGIYGWSQAVWPFWYPFLVFSPFIVDASVTLLKRLMRGEKVWQAHREHYYQRLVQMGWGHRKTALWGYGLMITAGGSAVLMLKQSAMAQGCFLAVWILIYAVLLFRVDQLWKRVLQ